MASTGTTTSTNKRRDLGRENRPRHWTSYVVPLLAGAIGVLLLILAVPRLIAAFIVLPTAPILQDVRDGKPVSREDLERLSVSQIRAAGYVDWGQLWTDAALADVTASLLPSIPIEEKLQLLNRADDSLRKGLSLAPANTFGWARFAYVRFVLGDRKQAADAIEMSILTGRYEPRLAPSRLDLAFLVWQSFSEDARDLLAEQVRWQWKKQPDDLLRSAIRRNMAAIVREQLEEEERPAFDKRVLALSSR